MLEGDHFVFGSEQELANDRIDNDVRDLERQLVVVNFPVPVQRVVVRHDLVEELDLVGR